MRSAEQIAGRKAAPAERAPTDRDLPETFYLVARDLALRLEPSLTRQGAELGFGVVCERRRNDRRGPHELRDSPWPASSTITDESLERRRVRNADGRRVGERRATLIPVAAPAEPPRRARPHADRLIFVERMAVSQEHQEDWDTARLVTRFQAGERELFTVIYERYFDRLYGYLRMALRDSHEAEDAAQQVFLQVMEALPSYELRAVPFRGWLFRIVRNYSINHFSKYQRIEVEDPVEIDRRRDLDIEIDPMVLDWLSDSDLTVLVERLPPLQRQVIMLRFMMDLTAPEIAEVIGRSPDAVRQLQQRAMNYLRDRLTAVGRGPRAAPERRISMPMRRIFRDAPVLRARRFSLAY